MERYLEMRYLDSRTTVVVSPLAYLLVTSPLPRGLLRISVYAARTRTVMLKDSVSGILVQVITTPGAELRCGILGV